MTAPQSGHRQLFVLVGGVPGSGKSTLARPLAGHLRLPLLAKDEIKEALMDALGAPDSVGRSQELGRAAVHAVLRAARGCPGAVIDSTWFPYIRPLAASLPGTVVEVRLVVPTALARVRYQARSRDGRHLDHQRSEQELWGEAVAPLGLGPLVEVDGASPVDVSEVAHRILMAASGVAEPSAGSG